MKELENGVNGSAYNAIASAAGAINVFRTNPYDHATVEETKVPSLWDFARLNRVVECVWNRTATGPQGLRVELMDLFLRLYPDNSDLFFW